MATVLLSQAALTRFTVLRPRHLLIIRTAKSVGHELQLTLLP
jgi:hypothetical protein